MGRKIPGRKHHGVKDPEKQRQQRLSKIKDKINAPPQDPDEQHIPKSLSRLVELKNKVKSGVFFKKKKKDDTKPKKQSKFADEKPIPEFKQRPGETDREFMNRVNRICQSVKREAAFENKYGVDVKRDENGQVTLVKRPKDALEMLSKQIRKEKKGKKKKRKTKEDQGPKLTKSQKWSLKKAEKKKKKKDEALKDFDFKDEVRFGEVAHAPPTLTAPKKVEKTQNAPRPGAKQLLLNSIIKGSSSSKETQKNKIENDLNQVKKTIDKKGKRKDLPNALRRQLEKQQKEIMEAYKQLKSVRYKQN